MKVFEVDQMTNTVVPTPSILLVGPFKEIWERDKTKEKARAMKELAYVYFMESLEKDNPYSDIPDDRLRERKVVEDIFGERYKPDTTVDEARQKLSEYYKSTFSYSYYKTALEAADGLRRYLDSVDFEERTKTGSMVHDPKKTQSILAETRKTLASLKELRDAVINESYDQDKLVSDRKRNYFED